MKKVALFLCFLFFFVNVFSQLSITTAVVNSCKGEILISVTGGTGVYTYEWFEENPTGSGTFSLRNDLTTRNVIGLSPGLYRVIVSDNSSPAKTVQAEYTITNPSALSLTMIHQGLICPEDPNSGAIIVDFPDGLSPYAWELLDGSNKQIRNGTKDGFSLTIANLTVGTYTFNWTDANGCVGTEMINIIAPAVRNLIINSTNDILCFGESNGAANITINGGWGPSYGIRLVKISGGTETEILAWTDIGVAQNYNINNLNAGNYKVYHQDRLFFSPFSTTYDLDTTSYNLCNKFEEFTINEPQQLSHTISGENLSCFGDTNGNIKGTISGGTAPYTILMDGTANQINVAQDGGSFDFSGLSRGTYTFTITDQNGCVIDPKPTATITEPQELVSDFVSKVDLFCNGDSDGKIIISVTGGTGPYVFSMNGVVTNPTAVNGTNYTIGNLTAGNYTINITDQNGCTATKVISQTITEPQSFTIAIAGETLICLGNADGNITGTVAGGVAPYTIVMDGTANQISGIPYGGAFDFSGLVAGDYNFTITDNVGCSQAVSASILENNLTLSVATTDVTCFGLSNGALDITPSGLPTPYSYTWEASNGGVVPTGQQNNEDINGLIRGTYRVTLVDGNGCVFTRSFDIVEKSQLSLNSVISDYNGFGVSSFGGNDGNIDLTPSGGTGVYTYTWVADQGGVIPTGQAANEDLTGLAVGRYTVTISDGNGCPLGPQSWVITEPLELLISEEVSSRQDVLCFGDATGVLKVNIDQGSVTPYDYILVNTDTGQIVSQADNQNVLSYTFTGLLAGNYRAEVVDANGILKSLSPLVISQPAGALSISNVVLSDYSGFGISCFGANDGSIDLTLTGGTPSYSYSWVGPNGFTSITEDINGLVPGNYTVTINDATGICTIVQTYTITEPTQLSLNSVISDYNGFGVSSFGGNDGNIDLTPSGGTGVYTYTWVADQGGVIPTGQAANEDLTGLAVGRYTVTISDGNGCPLGPQSWVITEPLELLISEEVSSRQDVLCFGDATGVLKVNIDQGSVTPYDYILVNTDTGQIVSQADNQNVLSYTFTGLLAGNYRAEVVDANGILKSLSPLVISQPAGALSISNVVLSDYSGFGISCFGANDGSIDLTLTGGTPSYSYSWVGPNGFTSITEDINGLVPGNYTVTINDATGICTIVQTYTITEPTQLSLNSVISDYNGFGVSSFGGNDGNIDLTPSGGTGVYTYTWVADQGGVIPTGQAANEDLTGLAVGRYTVTISDGNGCPLGPQSWVITEPLELLISEEVSSRQDVLCFGDATGVLKVNIDQGSVTPYDYILVNTDTGQIVSQADNQNVLSYTFTGLLAGNYRAEVLDANGLTKALSPIRISQPLDIVVSYTSSNISCFNANDGSIALKVTGGVSPYTYVWNDLATGANRINIGPGNYEVTITDGQGCKKTQEIEIIDAPLFEINPVVTNVSCFGLNDGTINLNLSGGQSPVVVTWSDGSTDGLVRNNLPPGTYDVVVSDTSSCLISRQFIITEPNQLVLNALIVDATDCLNPDSGSIDLQIQGGVTPFTIVWSNGATTEDLQNIGANTYTVEVTDGNRCKQSASYTVIRQEPLNLQIQKQFNVNCTTQSVSQLSELSINGGVAP